MTCEICGSPGAKKTMLREGAIVPNRVNQRPELHGTYSMWLCPTHIAATRLPRLPVDVPPNRTGPRHPQRDQMTIFDLLPGEFPDWT